MNKNLEHYMARLTSRQLEINCFEVRISFKCYLKIHLEPLRKHDVSPL
jgi:hypothetical protein